MAAIDPLEVPPFQLQPLLKDINPHAGDLLDLGQSRELSTPTVSSPLDIFARVSNSAIAKATARPPQPQAQVIARCAQALGRDVYVGNSDGTLVRYTLQDRGNSRDDVPAPSALSVPRRWGSTICCADGENYNILGLDQLSFLPVMPLPGMSSPGAIPRIIPSGDGGFVVLQASGEGSIAVFLTAGGDPGGALIEMPRFPIDIALDPPHFIALLPNNTIEIHNFTQQPPQLVQVIPRPEDFAPYTLSMGGGSGYLVSAGERDSKLSTTRVPLPLNPPEGKPGIKIDTNTLEGQPGSGLTPPSTPSPPSKDHMPTSYARSRILLTSNNAIQSLVPTTLLSQAESLLGAGREKDVIRLLDIVRKKTGDEDQDVQVRYIYTQLGYTKLRETHFEEAGNYLFRAETDARALIRLFPDLCEELSEYNNPEETMPVFKGLEETVRAAKSVEETDTVLARLFAEAGETTELLDLIKDSTLLTIQAIEPALVKHRQFQALIALCTKLEMSPAWLHDGEYVDASGGVKEPFERIIQILHRTQDAGLVQQYGIWVLKHDPALGLKIFTSRTIPKLDDAAVLVDMQSVNTLAASRFLEHVVLNKRSSDPNLHHQLVVRYVDEAIAILEKPGVQSLFSEIAQEYVKLPPSPFLLHVAKNSTMPEALDARIRLALFLQGSNLYNPRAVREKLQAPSANEIFAYERAIIDGKLGHHRKALTVLVHEVQDSVSAEAYCALGGVVIPTKVANSVGDRRGMQSYAWLVSVGGRRTAPVTEEKRRELLKTLMEVYTLGGEATAIQTAQLLNSQARNFDAVQVLEAIPEAWSLSVISSFLERSLRRTMHESREGMILKHISAGQNLAIVDDAMQVIKDEGYVVEEADDDDDVDSDAVLQQDPLDLDGPSSLVSEGLKRKEGWSEGDIPIS
ncbi:transforming growth factor-beta receptor-associated protein, putative, partial [Rhizoctonia solani AG-3 Rhs1AP]